MSEDPFAEAMQRLRAETVYNAAREQQIARLYEDAILQIRLSSALQKERLQAYIDGATLAAFQVHSTQIRLLETPPTLTGFSFWLDILESCALDSTLVGKVLGGVVTKLFNRQAIQRAVFLALPKSVKGKELVQEAKAISQGIASKAKDAAVVTTLSRNGVTVNAISSGKQASAFSKALSEKLEGKKREELYDATVVRFIAGESNTEKNLVAAWKTNKRARDKQRGRSSEPLADSDSPTTYLLSAVQQYAAVLRYNSEIELAELEHRIRGRYIEVEALEPLLAAWPVDELDTRVDGSDVPADLESLRQRFALTFECVMWAKLYGFDSKNPPDHTLISGTIYSVSSALVEYWKSRLLPATDDFMKNSYKTLTEEAKVQRLYDHMIAIGRRLNQNGLSGI